MDFLEICCTARVPNLSELVRRYYYYYYLVFSIRVNRFYESRRHAKLNFEIFVVDVGVDVVLNCRDFRSVSREKHNFRRWIELLLKKLDRAFSEAVARCFFRVFLEKFQEFVSFRNYHCCVPETIELLERTRHYSDESRAVALVGLLFDFYYLLLWMKFLDYLIRQVAEA